MLQAEPVCLLVLEPNDAFQWRAMLSQHQKMRLASILADGLVVELGTHELKGATLHPKPAGLSTISQLEIRILL